MGPRAGALAYTAGWRLARAVPEATAARLFELVADRTAARPGPGAAQLRRNLARVVPTATATELDALVRDGLRSYARYWREAFRLPSMDHRALYRRVDADLFGQEHLDAALSAGRGAILALPHTGNWDLAGVWLVGALRARGQPAAFCTVAERVRPESLYRRFVAYRERLGFEILPLTGGAAPLLDTLADRLAANRVICLLADRDLTPLGVPVQLFGQPASMPAGPARLAARTGAALLPVRCRFTTTGWDIGIHPPLAAAGVRETTQALADVFAGDIAARPADWHMLQPLWAADRAGRRGAALPQAG